MLTSNLDESFQDEGRRFCGLWPARSANTRAIPFYNILWAELLASEVTIHYAAPQTKNTVRAARVSYAVEPQDRSRASIWIDRLLDRAYGQAQKQKRAKVLVNPFSGKGSAQKWYSRDVEPILSAARCSVDMAKTKYRGEAIEIAEGLDIEAYDTIIACSGDGLPYEIFNGLGKRPDAKRALEKIAVALVPCGSGNAMSLNTLGTNSPSLATLAIIKGIPTPLDLVSITQGDTRTLSFLSQSVGIVAECDLGTDNLRWLGPARFTIGLLVRLLGKTVYPCDIAVKVAIEHKADIRAHYRREAHQRPTIPERRANIHTALGDDDSVSSSGPVDEGLPKLRYGTVNDKLPEDWETVPYDNLGNFYCGNMAYMAPDSNFFPATLPNDGYLDLVTIDGDIKRHKSIDLLLSVENGKFFDKSLVRYRKILGYRIIPKSKGEGYISIDGERVPFQPYQAEIHRGLGTVLSKSGYIYEAPGP
jgi:sphingosine kinase